MRASSVLLATFLALSSVSPALGATLLPLTMEEAEVLPSGHTEIVIGTAYTRNQRFPNFTPEGAIREQDLVSAPRIALQIGIADWAEVQASFEMLYLKEKLDNGDHNSQYGSGDARLFTKVRVLRQASWWPALGVRFGAKLPNANFDDRLGTDEIDFDITMLASRDFGVVAVHSNLGISLLGNPGPAIAGDTSFSSGGQDDLFLWAFGLTTQPVNMSGEATVRGLLEFAGNAGSRFDNDRAAFRFGAQFQCEPWELYLGASIGLVSGSEDVGAQGGVVYRFDLAALL